MQTTKTLIDLPIRANPHTTLHSLPNELHLQISTYLHASRTAYAHTNRRLYALLNRDFSRLSPAEHALPKTVHFRIFSHLPDFCSRNAYVCASARLHAILNHSLYRLAAAHRSAPRWVVTEGTEISTLARFLEAGLAVDARNYEDETLLMVATSIGWLEAARLLVEKGADVWARNGYGDTALHLASHVKMCRYLVEECGADVNACNRDGYTPLFLNVVGHVCSCCSEALVGALLRLGADPNLGTLEGEKPLREVGRLRRGVYRRNGDAAARKVSRRVEKLLVRYGAVV